MPPDSSLPSYIVHHPVSDRAVLFSVPHAGRHYPAQLLDRARVPVEALVKLEDRYADRLIGPVAALGFTTLIATYARAWIDLNRDPGEIDPAMIPTAELRACKIAQPQSAKVRGGLGLFPRRLSPYGDLWRGTFMWSDLRRRIETVHAPYHGAIETLLSEREQRHGFSVLFDIHSMPSLPGHDPAQLVIGDRHGASAPDWLVQHMEQEARLSGLKVKRNQPYAGGYVIARHSAPQRRRFAVQIEIDRACYLDAAGDPCPQACTAIGTMLGQMALAAEMALAARFGARPWLEAAE